MGGGKVKRSGRRTTGDLPSPASALATGGYGQRYQDAVDGWLLAHLLTGNALPGVPGVIVGVGFQRRSTGALLDDAVVTTDADIDIELSTKVGVKVAAGSDDFRRDH